MSVQPSRPSLRRRNHQHHDNDLDDRVAKVNQAADLFEALLSVSELYNQPLMYGNAMTEQQGNQTAVTRDDRRREAENEKLCEKPARLEVEAAVEYDELDAENARLQAKITQLELQADEQKRQLQAKNADLRMRLKYLKRQYNHFQGAMDESMVDLCKGCREFVGCCELAKAVRYDSEAVDLSGGRLTSGWTLVRHITTDVYRHSEKGTSYKLRKTDVMHE